MGRLRIDDLLAFLATPPDASEPVIALVLPVAARILVGDASRFLALLKPSVVGMRSRSGAPHCGASGFSSKSSARMVCDCSALAMSMLVD